MRPDQNNLYYPEWVDMGEEEEAPDFSPFAAALKKRFAGNKPTSLGEHGAVVPEGAGASGGATKGLGGEGMKSL